MSAKGSKDPERSLKRDINYVKEKDTQLLDVSACYNSEMSSHRLDSIAEESETSDNSIRSSNSNQNLNNANPYYVVKSHESRSIVVHMDTGW